MKVIQVGKYYPPYRGGMESFVASLAEGLAQKNVEVNAVVFSTRFRTSRRALDGVEIIESGCLFKAMSQPFCPAFPFHIRKMLPGIIHFHEPNPLGEISTLLTMRNNPLCITYHSDIVRQKFTGKFFKPFQKRILTKAKKIITTWPGQSEVSDTLKPFSEKCQTIPIGIDIKKFEHTMLSNASLPDKLKNESRPWLIFIGRMIWYKGLDVLLDALKLCKEDFAVAFVGTGPLLERMKIKSEENDILKNRCIWLGDVSENEKIQALKCSRGLLLPSIAPAEVFGVVQLEAMAAGVPIINTKLESGVPWVARNMKEAITVEPSNSEELAKACDRIITDHNLREELCGNGRERLLGKFSLEKMVSDYLEVYREIGSRF